MPAYVIIGCAGIYSDRREWAARVSLSEECARDLVLRLTADGERARREYAEMEDAIEEEAEYWIDPEKPDRWPPRLAALVAGMLDRDRALERALYYTSEPLRYRIEACEIENEPLEECPG